MTISALNVQEIDFCKENIVFVEKTFFRMEVCAFSVNCNVKNASIYRIIAQSVMRMINNLLMGNVNV